MSVPRGPQVRGRVLALLFAAAALLAIGGCGGGVSDSTTYPAPPDDTPPPYFYGVWGTGADDVYVVGQPGLIYHWDGAAWTRQPSPRNVPLTAVWGDTESGRVYVTGHRGVILRSSGDGVWTAMSSGTDQNLYDVGEFLQRRPEGDTREILAVGHAGTILRLAGDAWQRVDASIMLRNNQNAPVDTLSTTQDIVAFSTVFYYGLGGAFRDQRPESPGIKGCILVDDADLDFQLRLVAGGEGWVTSAVSSPQISGNYVATDRGRLFRMIVIGGNPVLIEIFSPALGEIVYGLWADPQQTIFAASNTGRVSSVTPPPTEFSLLYHDGRTLFDIWGAAADDLFAVGIDGRILRYAAPEGGGDPQWVRQDIELPADKALDDAGVDKFGRPL